MKDDSRPPEDEPQEEEPGARRPREKLLAGLVRKAISQGVEAISDDKTRDAIVAEVLRKARQTGHLVVDTTEDSVRRLVGDLPLPKEVVDRIVARFDDYKVDVLEAVKEELHDFLDRIDLGHELQKALTSLSLEVSTEIRFIPNDKKVGRVKADVKSKTRVRRTGPRRRRKDGDAKDGDARDGDEASAGDAQTDDAET